MRAEAADVRFAELDRELVGADGWGGERGGTMMVGVVVVVVVGCAVVVVVVRVRVVVMVVRVGRV